MPWKKILNIPVHVATVPTASTTSKTLLVTWESVAGANTYDVRIRKLAPVLGNWSTVVQNTSALQQTCADLDAQSTYEIDVIAHVTYDLSSKAQGTTLEAPARVIHRSSVFPAAVQNAMFQDMEPTESGVDGIPTIGPAGRTICSNYNTLPAPSRTAQHTIYGMRFLLGNMANRAISGGRMIVGLSVGWTGRWTPIIDGVEQNVITGNLMTGWQTVTINGDPSLPIPAAVQNASGMNLTCRWTDWLEIPAGLGMGMGGYDLLTRFLLPSRANAPYALTHGAWGEAAYQRNSVTAARNIVRADWWAGAGFGQPTEGYLRAEADYVTDPTIGNIVDVAGACPPDGTSFFASAYGPPGPVHTPLLAIQYATSLSEVQS